MLSVGIIAVAASLQNIMKIDEETRKSCNITYLSYTSKENLRYIYKENLNHFDALLFGGAYPCGVIKEAFGDVACPYGYFSIYARDYYRVIANLAVKYPGIDFSRVYFDAPEFPVDFTSVFEAPGLPLIGPADDHSISYDDFWEFSLERYLRLWESKKIDHLVTRFGSMTERLEKRGIPYTLLLPSKESMLETFYGLLVKTKETSPAQGNACICLLSVKKNEKENLSLLYERVCVLDRQLGNVFLIYNHANRLELTANAEAIRHISHQFTLCPILNYLKTGLDFPFSIGWGVANDIMQAHHNASLALFEASKQERSVSFLMTKDGYMIGPLEGLEALPVNRPGESLSDFSAAVNLKKHKKKLLELLSQKPEPIVTASELSAALGVTTRTAARLLVRLQEAEIATAVNRRKSDHAGRPTKYYFINVYRLK